MLSTVPHRYTALSGHPGLPCEARPIRSSSVRLAVSGRDPKMTATDPMPG